MMLDFAVLASRFGLSLVFLLAGVSKIRDRSGFEGTVDAYKLLPPRAVPVVARWLPWLELAAGALLAAGLAQRAVVAALVSLIAVFATAVGINLLRGRRIDCGCLGGGHPISWWTVARNLSLAGVASLVLRWPTTSLVPFSPEPPNVPATDALAVLVSSTMVVLMILLIGEARRLQRLLPIGRGRSAS